MSKKSKRRSSKISSQKAHRSEFSYATKETALLRSRRCCCVCQEFAGLFTNVHHITQKADGGSNDLDNAIVLCLRCHGEAGHYNPKHPIGNKYSPSELRRFRDTWWAWCEQNPYSPLPKEPLEVSPWQIDLAPEGYQTRVPIRVHNRSDRFIHQIWFKLFSDSPDVDLKRIRLEIPNPKNESRIEDVIPGVGLNTTGIKFDAVDDKGKQATYLLVDSIAPKEVMNLLLVDEAAPHAAAKLSFAICEFSFEPQKVLTKNQGIMIRIRPPESFTIVAQSQFLYRLPPIDNNS